MKIYQVDAFTSQKFSGNPAGVAIVEDFLELEVMQNIAMEMNLSETAFVKYKERNRYDIRFFTPSGEVDLCGHATLSSAHILYSLGKVDRSETILFSAKGGNLNIKNNDKLYSMGFPIWNFNKINDIQNAQSITNIEGILEIYESDKKWKILIVKNLKALSALTPNFSQMRGTDYGNIAVTCKGNKNYDYNMRCFVTDCGINEDPVTGSIECILGPLWAKKLGKTSMRCYQSSHRGGEKYIDIHDDKVVISGNAVTMGEMELFI